MKINTWNKILLSRTLTKRERLLLIILMAVIICYIIFVRLIPSINLLNAKKNELQQLKIKVADARKSTYFSQNLGFGLDDESNKLNALNKILGKLPNNPDIAQLITELENKCESHDVKILSVEQQEREERGKLKLLPIKVTLSGNYNSLISILEDLENSDGNSKIVNVSLNLREHDNGQIDLALNTWVLIFTINLYHIFATTSG
ncbi:MAG: type 4a pilus biogenesis protein PilO [Tepidanaerobacteraceae bacterium]|jgi:Tfp pilus assembly protein PilO